MSRRRITSQDVAKRAGVSRTTVSFVLNGVKEANISEETRLRVLAAAEELGYVPDAAAQALASGRTQTIGIVLSRDDPHPSGDSAHFRVIEGLMEVVRQSGVRLLIDSVRQTDASETYLNLARNKRIDGLILSDLRVDDPALHNLVNDGFPIVLLGGLPGVKVCSVAFDNYGGAEAAVDHLLKMGHTRIGVIAHAPAQFTGVAERLSGYRAALAAAGIAFDETIIRYGDYTPNSGFNAASSLLKNQSAPSAIFVTSDQVALGTLAAIRSYGLRIPEDVAVVGFDDHPLVQFADPPLTTVRLDFEEMGRQAGRLLLDRIAYNTEPGRQLLLQAQLIVRASSGDDSRLQLAPPHLGVEQLSS